jgi:integrase
LIFFCGLRPNEGRELQSCDIDFDKGILLVRKNKSHKERYVAMSDDVLQMCKDYHTSNADIFTGNTYFFPSPNGLPYNRRWLSGQFRMIWHKARATSNEASAVVYDLRHTFCIYSLRQFLKNGVDYRAALPILSVYMGHSSLSATGKYLRLTAEAYPEIVQKLEKEYGTIIPELEVQEDEAN